MCVGASGLRLFRDPRQKIRIKATPLPVAGRSAIQHQRTVPYLTVLTPSVHYSAACVFGMSSPGAVNQGILHPKRIILFGATGVIGTYILNALIQAQRPFEKIGIFTSPGTVERKVSQIQSFKDQGVEVIAGDLNNEEQAKKAYQGE